MTLLDQTEPFTSATIEAATKQFVQEKGVGMGQLMNPFRLCVVGTNAGPGMFDMAAVIGKEFIIPRIQIGIERVVLMTDSAI